MAKTDGEIMEANADRARARTAINERTWRRIGKNASWRTNHPPGTTASHVATHISSDGYTLRKHTPAECRTMCNGAASFEGHRHLYVVYTPAGDLLRDHPTLVCGGTIATAQESFARWERVQARRPTADEIARVAALTDREISEAAESLAHLPDTGPMSWDQWREIFDEHADADDWLALRDEAWRRIRAWVQSIERTQRDTLRDVHAGLLRIRREVPPGFTVIGDLAPRLDALAAQLAALLPE